MTLVTWLVDCLAYSDDDYEVAMRRVRELLDVDPDAEAQKVCVPLRTLLGNMARDRKEIVFCRRWGVLMVSMGCVVGSSTPFLPFVSGQHKRSALGSGGSVSKIVSAVIRCGSNPRR